MLKNLKEKALDGAMKVMQTDGAKKVMNSAEFQKMMMKAFQASFKVKQDLDEAKRTLAKRLNVATGDDLRDLKRTIDRLERRVKDLKRENEDLKTKVGDDR
jgi:polyhydroxyalkanoate synthesis regulator phasin